MFRGTRTPASPQEKTTGPKTEILYCFLPKRLHHWNRDMFKKSSPYINCFGISWPLVSLCQLQLCRLQRTLNHHMKEIPKCNTHWLVLQPRYRQNKNLGQCSYCLFVILQAYMTPWCNQSGYKFWLIPSHLQALPLQKLSMHDALLQSKFLLIVHDKAFMCDCPITKYILINDATLGYCLIIWNIHNSAPVQSYANKITEFCCISNILPTIHILQH
jgi:hypothetical protein